MKLPRDRIAEGSDLGALDQGDVTRQQFFGYVKTKLANQDKCPVRLRGVRRSAYLRDSSSRQPKKTSAAPNARSNHDETREARND